MRTRFEIRWTMITQAIKSVQASGHRKNLVRRMPRAFVQLLYCGSQQMVPVRWGAHSCTVISRFWLGTACNPPLTSHLRCHSRRRLKTVFLAAFDLKRNHQARRCAARTSSRTRDQCISCLPMLCGTSHGRLMVKHGTETASHAAVVHM